MIKALFAGALLGSLGFLIGAPAVRADPLIPISPAENAYLEHVHRVVPPGDPIAFHNDGWYLDQGWRVCHDRGIPLYGGEATFVSPILSKAAFTFLCPT